MILNIFNNQFDPWDLIFAYRHSTSHAFKNIHSIHFTYMALNYAWFFFCGNNDWHWNLIFTNDKKFDQLFFYKYWIYYCNDHLSLLHYNKIFFGQFVVNVEACAEKIRLNWIYNNQRNFHANIYNGLTNAFVNDHLNSIEQNCHVLFVSFIDNKWFM